MGVRFNFALLTAIVLCSSHTLSCQDLRPRACAITPVRSNALILSYAFNNGSIFFGSVLPITNASGRYSVPALSYLTMLKLTIAPHTKLPWHTHPFPNAAYVLSGTLTVHDKLSGKTKVFHQGEAFAESVNDIHRGEAGGEPVVLLVTYSGTPGVPTSIPAKGEQAEY
jgi:quercetin dioxygenase-like cupin family protein